MIQQGKRRHPSYVLLIVTLLFLIPLALAWILYLEKNTLGEGKTNHGYLITPPFAITKLKLYSFRGKSLDNRSAQNSMEHPPVSPYHTGGKWLLLYLFPNPCDRQCQQGLYKMRQIRLATGKNRDRVARAILTYLNQPPDPKLTAMLANEYKGTQHLMVTKQQFKNVIKHNVHMALATEQGTLYIVDPLGNVMMFYKTNANPNGIFKDIQRLLKVSQIG